MWHLWEDGLVDDLPSGLPLTTVERGVLKRLAYIVMADRCIRGWIERVESSDDTGSNPVDYLGLLRKAKEKIAHVLRSSQDHGIDLREHWDDVAETFSESDAIVLSLYQTALSLD